MNHKIPLLAFFVLSLSFANVQAEDFYGFQKILKGPTVKRGKEFRPNKLEADLNGGTIILTMPDTAEKKYADYEFQWKFLDDISRIVPGKKYNFEMRGRRVLGNADKNTNTAWMMSSNQGSVLAKKKGIQSLANVLSVKKSKANVVAWPKQANNVATGTVEIVGNPTEETTYFTFKFDFASFPYAYNSKACSFEVVYVYKKNVASAGEKSQIDENAVFETYLDSDHQRFQFQRRGDNLIGTRKVEGIGSTKVKARRTFKTVSGNNGNRIEIVGFEGVFITELNNGQRVQGMTSITPTGTAGKLKVTSTYYQNGKEITQSDVVTRESIFK